MHMKFENHSGWSLKSPGERSNTLIPRWHPQKAGALVSLILQVPWAFYVQLGLRAKLWPGMRLQNGREGLASSQLCFWQSHLMPETGHHLSDVQQLPRGHRLPRGPEFLAADLYMPAACTPPGVPELHGSTCHWLYLPGCCSSPPCKLPALTRESLKDPDEGPTPRAGCRRKPL